MILTLSYSVSTVVSVCTHPCGKNTFAHSLTKIHLLRLKMYIWMEFFRNQFFLFIHKRNSKIIYKLFLIKLPADIIEYFPFFQQVIVFSLLTDFEM